MKKSYFLIIFLIATNAQAGLWQKFKNFFGYTEPEPAITHQQDQDPDDSSSDGHSAEETAEPESPLREDENEDEDHFKKPNPYPIFSSYHSPSQHASVEEILPIAEDPFVTRAKEYLDELSKMDTASERVRYQLADKDYGDRLMQAGESFFHRAHVGEPVLAPEDKELVLRAARELYTLLSDFAHHPGARERLAHMFETGVGAEKNSLRAQLLSAGARIHKAGQAYQPVIDKHGPYDPYVYELKSTKARYENPRDDEDDRNRRYIDHEIKMGLLAKARERGEDPERLLNKFRLQRHELKLAKERENRYIASPL
jgi:hypothetical protein